jgi:predicted RecA/RadA family phage recombinase
LISTFTGTTARSPSFGTPSEANSISLIVNAGGGNVTITGRVRNLTFSGTFAGVYRNAALTLYGSLAFKTGMTITAGTEVRTFAATSGTQSITSAGLNLNFPITFSGTATYRLQDALAVGISSPIFITLNSGTLNLNNFTLTHFGIFSSNNANIRSIAFGTGSYVNILFGSYTYWDFANTTNFTYTGTSKVEFFPTSGFCTINHGNGGGSEATAISFGFGINSPGGATINFGASYILDLTILNTSYGPHAYSNTTPTIYGSYLNQNNSSSTSPFTSITLASTNTSRINFIQSSPAMPATVNVNGGVGTIYKLLGISNGGAWNVSSSLDTNGYVLPCTSFNFNNSNTKTITVSSGSFIRVDTNFYGGTGAFVGSMVGTTLNLSGSHIQFVSNGTFNVPNSTFPELRVDSRYYFTSITVTIGSSGNTQTITTIKEDEGTGAGKIVLAANSTLNVVDMVYTGFSVAPLTTNISGSQATLRKTSGTLLVSKRSIKDIVATGGAAFKAPTESPYNNVDAGNNVGWNFGPYSPYSSNSNFFMFF